MTARIASLAWYLLLLLMAVIVIGVQLDRQAIKDPAISLTVPAPFRSVAQQKLALSALASGQEQAALEFTTELVMRRPMPAENLVILARAQVLAGEEARAIPTLEAASTRGWRQPVAQNAVAEAALNSGQYEIAANRLAAVLAMGQSDEYFDALLARMLSTEEGRQAFAGRLAIEGGWQGTFMAAAMDKIPAADLADTLVRANALGARLPCDRIVNFARTIERSGLNDLAEQVRPDYCRA